MITEDYVSFEIAKLLKEKGFPQEYDIYHSMVYNEEDYEDEYEVQRMVLETRLIKTGTLSSYPIGIPEPKCYCPTHQMAMKWLREVYDIFIDIGYDDLDWYWLIESISKDIPYEDRPKLIKNGTACHKTYEETVEAALKFTLENLI